MCNRSYPIFIVLAVVSGVSAFVTSLFRLGILAYFLMVIGAMVLLSIPSLLHERKWRAAWHALRCPGCGELCGGKTSLSFMRQGEVTRQCDRCGTVARYAHRDDLMPTTGEPIVGSVVTPPSGAAGAAAARGAE